MYLSLNIKQSISIYKIEVVKMFICQSAQKYNLYYNFPSGNASSVVLISSVNLTRNHLEAHF